MISIYVAENILFGKDDLKLGDIGSTVGRGETTWNVGVRGTVPYIPKELFCGGEYRASVDIYEAGGVILNLLTGAPPWTGWERQTIMYKVRREMIYLMLYINKNTCTIQL